MCGIIGGLLSETLHRSVINHALALLVHRGPDDAGVYQDGTVFLGMRRLSIIDIDGGHQPLFNEDGSVAVVFNGEIYNYTEKIPELQARGHQFRTQSDTEVLLHLYEEMGERMVHELRGMFAFAIWDNNRRQLFVARDRFGKKPLYYTRTPTGGLLFASELKALHPLAIATGCKWEISEQAIYDYLSLQVVPQPNTIFKNVWMLPAATGLRFDGDNWKSNTYWELPSEIQTQSSYAEVLERTSQLISEAVRLRLRSDVPIGVFLSGGIDSSIVAYEAARNSASQLQTFTVSLEEKVLDEAPIAKRTADALGVANSVLPLKIQPLETLQFIVRHFDQPFAEPSAIPSHAISKLARKNVTVILNGDGGDELFAGYRRYLAASYFRGWNWLPNYLFKFIATILQQFGPARRSHLGFYARFARGMSLSPGARYIAWTTDMLQEADKLEHWKANPVRATETWITSQLPRNASELQTLRRGDIKINLLSALLVKMDMATMAASLEARCPFLDHIVAEFAATLPSDYLLRGGRTKAILRDAYRGKLPEEVLTGAKRGFEIPLVSWLQTDFRSILFDSLGSRTAKVRGYLDDRLITRLLEGKSLKDRNWGYIVYAVLVLELWLQEL